MAPDQPLPPGAGKEDVSVFERMADKEKVYEDEARRIKVQMDQMPLGEARDLLVGKRNIFLDFALMLYVFRRKYGHCSEEEVKQRLNVRLAKEQQRAEKYLREAKTMTPLPHETQAQIDSWKWVYQGRAAQLSLLIKELQSLIQV